MIPQLSAADSRESFDACHSRKLMELLGVVLATSASLREVRACEEHWVPRRKTSFIVDLIRAIMASILPSVRIVCIPTFFVRRCIIDHSPYTAKMRLSLYLTIARSINAQHYRSSTTGKLTRHCWSSEASRSFLLYFIACRSPSRRLALPVHHLSRPTRFHQRMKKVATAMATTLTNLANRRCPVV